MDREVFIKIPSGEIVAWGERHRCNPSGQIREIPGPEEWGGKNYLLFIRRSIGGDWIQVRVGGLRPASQEGEP